MKSLQNSVEEKKSEKTIYNPLINDYTYSYDGGKETYTIFAGEVGTFPSHIADRMAKNIADKMVVKRGLKQKTPNQRREEELKGIYTDL